LAYKLTNERFHYLANGFIFSIVVITLIRAFKGDFVNESVVKFAIDTAPSWLTFFSILFGAMLVFIGFIYTVQDELFWELLSSKVNLEQKAYKAILLLGVACLSLIVISQPRPTVQAWRSAGAMLGILSGSQGIIKVAGVFSIFYSLDYAGERQRRRQTKHKEINPDSHSKSTKA
jgi:hypothetical protein